jgi:hypothetical protein
MMVETLEKLAEVRGAELDRKGGKEGKAEGTSEHISLTEHRAGRLRGGELVTGPLDRMA